jgi:glutamyl-tRNA reductase
VGLDHEHVSRDLLERATVSEHDWGKVLRTLVAQRNVHEAVFVSTCLRTEVVATIDLFHGAIEDITATLAQVTGLDRAEFDGQLTVHFDRGVVTHLFQVAAGLKSLVPGEFEILGQLRRALDLAREEQTVGAELTELFHRALAAGRRARAETGIARGTTSFAQASVSMAHGELGTSLAGADVLVVGAGQLATGVARSLLDRDPAVGTVTIVNRSAPRGEALARSLDDPRVASAPWSTLATHAVRARLIVMAIETVAPVVTRATLEGVGHDVMVVDLGVPRSVSADVAALTRVRLVGLDEVGLRVREAIGARQGALDQARDLVRGDVERFVDDQRARGAAIIVRDLRAHLDEVVNAELARRDHDLDALSEAQRDVVRSVVRSVVAKIAHRPTIALRDAAGTDQGARLTEATRQLFDL